MRVLTLCDLTALSAEVAGDDGTGKDGKALQGTWQAVSGESSKERMTPVEAKATRLEFKEGTVILTVEKEVLQATYRLDPSKKLR